MIKLNNVSKVDKKGNEILKDINLEINDNDFVVIKGESGSGKTTLANIIGGIATYQEGEYVFKDNVVKTSKDMLKLRRNEVSFVTQDFSLLNSLSVKDNLEIFKNGDYLEILKSLDIEDLVKKKVSLLSGGEKQRVAIARAIYKGDDLIICDEPTGALDSQTGELIVGILLDLHKKGKTIILITHSAKLFSIGNRVITLKDGKIVD